MKRTGLILGAVVVIAAAAAVAIAISRGGNAAGPSRPALTTAQVSRGDLVSTRLIPGTVGYGDATPVQPPAPGIVTALAAVGATVARGQTLYALDDQPVVVLYGDLPFYRRLAPGISGRDVRELKDNLTALGFTGLSTDNSYTSQTADAVRRWQKSLGVPQTGAVELGQVICEPGPVRVADHRAVKGARVTDEVLGITGTARLVTVPLVPADRSLAKAGTPVDLVLPDGTTVPGVVTDIAPAAANAGQAPATQPSVQATVTPSDQSKFGAAADAGVQVRFTVAKHAAVLSVPVLALLALPDGGYGVEVVDGDSTRTVPVEVGMFASGRVEISGTGIAAGQLVKVPTP